MSVKPPTTTPQGPSDGASETDPRRPRVVGWKRSQVLGTRLHLIETARELFGERGYARSPLEEVVRRAGLTRGALYHHFADKQALFEAVMDQLLWDVVNEVDRRVVKRSVARGEEREVDAVELLVEELGRPMNHRILCVDGPAVLGRDRWGELLSSRLLEPVRRLVAPLADAGALDSRHVAAVSRLLLASVQEAAHRVAGDDAGEAPADRGDLDAALAWLFARVLRQ